MDPTFDLTHWFLGQAYENKGQLVKAVAEYEKATQLSPDPAVFASLARAYALSGRKEEARKILATLTSESQKRYIPAYSLAVVHLSLGEKEEALLWLERATTTAPPSTPASSAVLRSTGGSTRCAGIRVSKHSSGK